MTNETTNIQKTLTEKSQDFIKAKFKCDKDLILYWHFQTIKDDLINDIKNESEG